MANVGHKLSQTVGATVEYSRLDQFFSILCLIFIKVNLGPLKPRSISWQLLITPLNLTALFLLMGLPPCLSATSIG